MLILNLKNPHAPRLLKYLKRHWLTEFIYYYFYRGINSAIMSFKFRFVIQYCILIIAFLMAYEIWVIRSKT